MDSLVVKYQQKLEVFRRTYMAQQDELAALLTLAQSLKITDENMADLGFLCREIGKVLDDLRKEFNAKSEFLAKVICLRAVHSGAHEPIRGDLATATPTPKLAATLPKRGTPEYYALMEWLGVPREAAETKVLDFHFKGLEELITQRVENGAEKPPINVAHTSYTCSFRARK